PAPTGTYTPSLHDALPICRADRGAALTPVVIGPDLEHPTRTTRDEEPPVHQRQVGRHLGNTGDLDDPHLADAVEGGGDRRVRSPDRKSTRLNSSHVKTPYA